MTTIPLPDVRVKPGTFFEVNANHISIWGYRTTDPWDAILKPNYFLPLWNRFCSIPTGQKKRMWTPDTIRVARVVQSGPDQPHWWETGELVITHASEQQVTVELVARPRIIGAPQGIEVSWPPKEAKKAA